MKILNLDMRGIETAYLSGKTIREIAKENGVSYTPIYERLKKVKVKFRKGEILKGLESEINEKYAKNKNCSILANEYGVSIPTMITFLRKMGNQTKRKTLELNHGFFENIDSPLKAYWFGWMMSDGNVHKNRIKLSITDPEILEMFKKDLDFEGKIHRYLTGYKDCFCLSFTSKKMACDLIRHGCVERKTFKGKFPKIEDNLIKYFIRGYFEGDGYAGIKRRNNQARISFVGNKSIINGIVKFLKKNCNINFYLMSKDNGNGLYLEASCSGNLQIKRFRDLIYNPEELTNRFLARKLGILNRIE